MTSANGSDLAKLVWRVNSLAIAHEQAALRRVASLVAEAAQPADVFAAVAEEVGRLLPADLTLIGRFVGDGAVTGVAGWSRTGQPVSLGPVRVGGRNVTARVFESGRPARLDSYEDATGAVAEQARALDIRSSVGVPISLEGRVWGIMIAASTGEEPPPPHTEAWLADFTQLVATAIANAQGRERLRALAAEPAALGRVATLVARGAPPAMVFAAVAEEVGRVLSADVVIVSRFDPAGSNVTIVGRWTRSGEVLPLGERQPMGGPSVSALPPRATVAP